MRASMQSEYIMEEVRRLRQKFGRQNLFFIKLDSFLTKECQIRERGGIEGKL